MRTIGTTTTAGVLGLFFGLAVLASAILWAGDAVADVRPPDDAVTGGAVPGNTQGIS